MAYGQKTLATLELQNEVEVEFLEDGTIALNREQLGHDGETMYIDTIFIGKEHLKKLLEISEQVYGN